MTNRQRSDAFHALKVLQTYYMTTDAMMHVKSALKPLNNAVYLVRYASDAKHPVYKGKLAYTMRQIHNLKGGNFPIALDHRLVLLIIKTLQDMLNERDNELAKNSMAMSQYDDLIARLHASGERYESLKKECDAWRLQAHTMTFAMLDTQKQNWFKRVYYAIFNIHSTRWKKAIARALELNVEYGYIDKAGKVIPGM